MQTVFKQKGLISLLALGTISLTIHFLSNSVIADIADAITSDGFPESEYYQLVEGSISDGDTLRVTDGSRELKIRLCGIGHLSWRAFGD